MNCQPAFSLMMWRGLITGQSRSLLIPTSEGDGGGKEKMQNDKSRFKGQTYRFALDIATFVECPPKG